MEQKKSELLGVMVSLDYMFGKDYSNFSVDKNKFINADGNSHYALVHVGTRFPLILGKIEDKKLQIDLHKIEEDFDKINIEKIEKFLKSEKRQYSIKSTPDRVLYSIA